MPATLTRGRTAAVHPPTRSRQQRLDALDRANEIRTYRKDLKRDMRAGRRRLGDVLRFDSHDEHLTTMKVYDLLVAAPKVGRVKANKALTRTGVSPSKTLAGITDRQRSALLEHIGAR